MDAANDLFVRWMNLEQKMVERFGKKPDLEAILFLIGMQETGFIRKKITKEQKQDLMHVALCTLLSESGYYERTHKDKDGWPHFKQVKDLSGISLMEQENLLKDHILFYFEQQNF